jgi:hypothetical protein
VHRNKQCRHDHRCDGARTMAVAFWRTSP